VVRAECEGRSELIRSKVIEAVSNAAFVGG